MNWRGLAGRARRLLVLPGWSRMSEAEYRANLNGLSIFFGAVLGFVMASVETLPPRDFAMTLFFTATMVITILYVNSSHHRFSYALMAAVIIAIYPYALKIVLTPGAKLPPQLQLTLAVWLGFSLLVEILPRERPDTTTAREDD
jgi:hypothetical protein